MPAPISIIIPTLDAATELPSCMSSLLPGLSEGLVREVLIVDGGSEDDTCRLAKASGARIFTQQTRGRGPQMNIGANAARGDWLLFLHADTALSADWAERAAAHIYEHADKAAAFTLAFKSDARMARIVANRANWRARVLGLPYGDQGLLISKPLFTALGGFPDTPFMEDVAFIRRLRSNQLRILASEARTSAAKYEQTGWRKRSWHNLFLLLRFLLGAKPENLARRYR
ncbi:MAG: glycosyl transferase [Hyphomonadaceae bacterium]|nr:glycosyl transferase [Hyphomonadaceae bacterium]OUX95748.1 MAG: glycosyl transferase [Hyphomonas sp. TMED17]CAI8362076.1 MAG: PGL/p-HBAD biosynthesis glycosyltransferase [Hyphomonas sp. TMED17]